MPAMSTPGSERSGAPHIALGRGALRVVIDSQSGALRDIVHAAAGVSLVARPDVAARFPFAIVLENGTLVRDWIACRIERQGDEATTIAWALERDMSLTVWLRCSDQGELRLTMRLDNPQDAPVAAVAYPYIAGVGRLGADPERDGLVHPYATGFLVRNPLDNLPPVASETAGQQPIVLGLYPEGFSGSTMQFMAYSAAGRGGFYIATEDGSGRTKWLNFYRHPYGDLRLSVWHGPSDLAERCCIVPGYDTIIACLDGGSWYDAADRYKAWAHAQTWVSHGPVADRDDRPRRLLEEVGLCTFGINARYNRVPWLAEIDRIAGTPVLHLLGPNWPRYGADYMNRLPGGLADWFPARLDSDNLALIRRNRDLVIPFEFDLLFGHREGQAEAATGQQALQAIPRPTLSRDAYNFPFLCPLSPFTQELHVARDSTLVREVGVDGVYYDISVNNVRHNCLSSDHGHAAGSTVTVTEAYRAMLAATGRAMREAAGGQVLPQGTEMINELMLPVVAFYQARAEAGLSAPFEAGPFRDLIKSGAAEKIPLFTYVYHEYGPLRLDGWAKLSREQGDYVYFALGRVFLQGGLIELNYEFSPLEDLDGAHDSADEHYWRFDERRYAIDPEVARFVGCLARARVGPANRYLAYGAMLRPAPLAVDGEGRVQLSYFVYNCDQKFREFEDRGTVTVPAVLQVAWCYRDEGVAWLLLNIATDKRAVHLHIDSAVVGQSVPLPWRLSVRAADGTQPAKDLGVMTDPRVVTLTLPSRSPVLLEAVPAGDLGNLDNS